MSKQLTCRRAFLGINLFTRRVRARIRDRIRVRIRVLGLETEDAYTRETKKTGQERFAKKT
jgi:hypothetical protein